MKGNRFQILSCQKQFDACKTLCMSSKLCLKSGNLFEKIMEISAAKSRRRRWENITVQSSIKYISNKVYFFDLRSVFVDIGLNSLFIVINNQFFLVYFTNFETVLLHDHLASSCSHFSVRLYVSFCLLPL